MADVAVEPSAGLSIALTEVELGAQAALGPEGLTFELGIETEPGSGATVQVAGDSPMEVATELLLSLGATSPDLDAVDLRGRLALESATVDVGDGPRPLVLALDLGGGAELVQGLASLDRISLDLGDAGSLDATVRIEEFLGAQRLRATVPSVDLRLEELLPLASPFIPDLSASGSVRIDGLTVDGALDGGTAERPVAVRGTVGLADVSVAYPDVGVEVEDLDLDLALDPVELVGWLPAVVRVQGGASLATAIIPGDGRVEGVSLDLVSSAREASGVADFRDVDAELGLQIAGLVPPGLAGGAPIPVQARVTTSADLSTGQISDLRTELRIPGVLAIDLTGDLASFGTGAALVRTSVRLWPGPALRHVPPEMLGEIASAQLDGEIRLDTTTSGDLGTGALDVDGHLTLASLSASGLPASASVGALGAEIDLTLRLLEASSPVRPRSTAPSTSARSPPSRRWTSRESRSASTWRPTPSPRPTS